jgi:hypothetical protein
MQIKVKMMHKQNKIWGDFYFYFYVIIECNILFSHKSFLMIFFNLQIQIFWKYSRISIHQRGWVWLMLTRGNTHMFQLEVIWPLYKMF